MLQNVIAIIWILYTHTWINIHRKVNHRPEVTCDHTGIMLHNTCIAFHNQTNVILQWSICLQPISWLSFVHSSCLRYNAVYKKHVDCVWWSKQYSVNNAALSHLRHLLDDTFTKPWRPGLILLYFVHIYHTKYYHIFTMTMLGWHM